MSTQQGAREKQYFIAEGRRFIDIYTYDAVCKERDEARAVAEKLALQQNTELMAANFRANCAEKDRDRLAAELEMAKQKNETHLELIKLYRSEIHYLKHEKTNTREEIDKMRELLYQTHGNGD